MDRLRVCRYQLQRAVGRGKLFLVLADVRIQLSERSPERSQPQGGFSLRFHRVDERLQAGNPFLRGALQEVSAPHLSHGARLALTVTELPVEGSGFLQKP